MFICQSSHVGASYTKSASVFTGTGPVTDERCLFPTSRRQFPISRRPFPTSRRPFSTSRHPFPTNKHLSPPIGPPFLHRLSFHLHRRWFFSIEIHFSALAWVFFTFAFCFFAATLVFPVGFSPRNCQIIFEILIMDNFFYMSVTRACTLKRRNGQTHSNTL